VRRQQYKQPYQWMAPALALAVGVLSAHVQAQRDGTPPPPAGGAAGRQGRGGQDGRGAGGAGALDGRGGPPPSPKAAAPIDLTGYWVSVVSEDWRYRMVTPAKGDYQGVPMTPEALKVADAWDPAADEAAGNQCKSYGAAAIMRVPGPRGTEPFAATTVTSTTAGCAAPCRASAAIQSSIGGSIQPAGRTASTALRMASPVAGASSGGLIR